MIAHTNVQYNVGDVITGAHDHDYNWHPEAKAVVLRESNLEEYIKSGIKMWGSGWTVEYDMRAKGLDPKDLYFYEISTD